MSRLSSVTNFVNFASDATETQIAAVQMDDRENFLAYKQDGNILVNELKGALLAMNMALKGHVLG
jgi:hypothetical protein